MPVSPAETEDAALSAGVIAGERRAIAKAITLLESTRSDHRHRADDHERGHGEIEQAEIEHDILEERHGEHMGHRTRGNDRDPVRSRERDDYLGDELRLTLEAAN